MRWDDSHESPDVIDRRGEGPVRGGGGGLPTGLLYLLPWLIRTPFGWVIIVIAIGFYVVRGLFGAVATGQRAHGGNLPTSETRGETPEVHFVSFVLDDVQASWEAQFAKLPRDYRH